MATFSLSNRVAIRREFGLGIRDVKCRIREGECHIRDVKCHIPGSELDYFYDEPQSDHHKEGGTNEDFYGFLAIKVLADESRRTGDRLPLHL